MPEETLSALGACEETLSALGACKRFECQVIGLPRPSVRWYKDGVNITTRPRYKFEYTPDGCVILVLKNVTRDDQGIYSCRAQNSEGSAETSAQLYVKGVTSDADEEEVSTYMMSFHKIADDTDMSELLTSSSLRRPLHIGDRNKDAASDTSEDSVLCRSMESEFSMQSEETGVLREERTEHVRYGETYRRVTTDSGITSRGSSFSSEHDLDLSKSNMQEMKEYLHGKNADFFKKVEEGIAAEHHHGKMQRQEEHPGLLDHELIDNAESRVMAGMYLFSNEAEIHLPDEHEIAHEILYMYKADKAEGSTPDPLLMETVLKEISSSTDHYQFETRDESETISMTNSSISSVTANASKQEGLAANVTSSEIDGTEYLEKEVMKATDAVVECKAIESVDGLGISKQVSTDISSQSKSTLLEETVKVDTVAELQSSIDSIKDSVKTESDILETTVSTESTKENIVEAVTAGVLEESETVRNIEQKSETEKAETNVAEKVEANVCVEKSEVLETKVHRMSEDLSEQDELSESELKTEAIAPTNVEQESTVRADISATVEQTSIDKKLESTEIIEMENTDKSTVTSNSDDRSESVVSETKEKATLHRAESRTDEMLEGQQEVTEPGQEDALTTDAESETVKSDTIQSADRTIKEKPDLCQMESMADEVMENKAAEIEQDGQTIAAENSQETVAAVDHESSVKYETLSSKDSNHEPVEILEAADEDKIQTMPDKTSTEIDKTGDVSAGEINKNKRDETLIEEQTNINEASKLNDTAPEALQSQSVDSETIPNTAVATENSPASIADSQVKDSDLTSVNEKDVTANEKDVTVNEKDVTVNEKDVTANVKDVTVNEKDVTANEKDVTVIEKDVTAKEKDVTANEKDVKTINEQDIALVNETDVTSVNNQDIVPVIEKNAASVDEKVSAPVNEKDLSSANEKDSVSMSEKDTASDNENDKGSLNEKDTLSADVNNTMSVNQKEVETSNEKDSVPVNVKDVASANEKNDVPVIGKDVASASVENLPPVNEKDNVSVKDEVVASVNKNETASVNEMAIASVNEKDIASDNKKDVKPSNEKEVDSVIKDVVASNENAAVISEKVAAPVNKDTEAVKEKEVASVKPKDVTTSNDKVDMAVGETVVASSEGKEEENKERAGINVEVLMESSDVFIKQGEDLALQWKITGIDVSSASVFKDGLKLQQDGRVQLDVSGDICTLAVSEATVDDDATYSVRVDSSSVDEGPITVNIIVSASTRSSRDAPEEPDFVIKPTVDVDGRRLSLKCSVSGFPTPQVTWFRQGEKLDQDALWEVYCQDGFHFLEIADLSVLECEQIVCRVENNAGYAQSVVLLKKDGDEVYCEPVFPPVTVETQQSISPVLELEVSETNTDNLCQYCVSGPHTDPWNYVSLNGGESVQVLGRYDTGSVLARHVEEVSQVGLNGGESVQVLGRNDTGSVLARSVEEASQICYVPQDLLVYMNSAAADAGAAECNSEQNARTKINTTADKQGVSDRKNTETKDKMPERRKMKSPSPKMTSTPKMKRKGHDRDSPTELQARLGLKDTQDSQKGVSYDDMDYNDGTTRPMFKKRLRNQTANGGEKAQLECVVSGTPLPKVLWLKNNRPLKAADGCKVFTNEETNILEFPAAKDDDVGVYTARAMNVNGSVTSTAEFTLTEGVGLPAQTTSDGIMDLDFTTPAYFFQMSSCEVAEGRLARFDCRVVAYPRPEIVWMRDGKVVESGDRFKLLNFNNEIYSLLIQDVKLTDTGRYTCWARNKFGEAMTEAYLNVIALSEQQDEGDIAPKFLTRFYDQQTAEGTPTDFKCLIAGRPEPSVVWLCENMELRDAPGTRIRRKDGMVSLEIKSPKVDQSGEYTCQLSNTLGDATCSARLTVVEDKLHGKMLPKFIKKFDHINAKEGEEIQFKCAIVGEPKPEVSWLMDHKPMSDTNRRYAVKKDGDVYTLTIKDVRFDDTCTVTCKAVNSEGESYCSANLHIRESKFITDVAEKAGRKMEDQLDSKFGYVPTFTKRLQDTEVSEGTRARFECKVMGIPEPEVAWMKDGRVIVPGGRYHMTRDGGTCQLTIDNVTSTDTGVYTCIISNNQGKSSSTAHLKMEGVKKERYTPERFLDERVKKERYTPERFLDERTLRKERYTPDKYLLDDSTPVKRPYLDRDLIDVKPRRSYESPALPKPYEPRKSYELPVLPKPYEPRKSYEPPALPPIKTYDDTSARSRRNRYSRPLSGPISLSFDDTITPTTSLPTRSFETPLTKYDDTSLTRPRVRFSTPPLSKHDLMTSSSSRRFETPSRYDDLSKTYKRRSYESPLGWFDDSSVTIPRRAYESPVRAREPEIKVAPKIPYERPTILNKREDSVRLSWLPAPTLGLPIDAQRISYIVESREVPGQEWTKIATSVPMRSYLVRHLRPDKEYEFRVRAQNQHGVSEPTWAAPLEKRLDESRRFADLPEMRAPPRLPTHRPIITDLGEETVRLAWRPAETYQAKRAPPVSYRLEARELPGKDWMPLSSRLRDTSHYLSELPLDRDYMIRVRAENDFGISEPTDSLWLPRARAFPGVPVSRPEIVDLEATRAKLSWTRVDIPTFGLADTPLMYMLEVEEPPHDWRPIARDLDDTEYIVEGLKPDRDYRFRVRAKTPAGVVSEPSPATSLYTALARSRAPVDRLEVTGYEPDTRSLNLAWQRVEIPPYNLDEEPLMYMLEYQEPPLPDWRPLVTGVPTTRYRVMHIDPERDYNFRVRAVTPYGISPPSPALPVSLRQGPVAAPLPEAVIISEVESDSLRLTWRRPMTDLSQQVSYRVEMLEPPMSQWTPIATGVTETTYKVKGLRPTKDYQFRVIPQISTRMLAASPAVGLTSAAVRPRLPISEPLLKELSPESVQLSWRPAEHPVYQRSRVPMYYGVEMMELPGTAWVPVARRVPDTSYNVTGLRPDRDYKFRVIAETDVGVSQPSMPTTLRRRPAPVFSTMEPAIKDISPNIVLLTWQPADIPSGVSPVSYRVEMQSPPGISTWNTLYAHHPTPNVRLADLRPDLDYLVRVRAECDGYLSEPTLPVYIPRRAVPPRIPLEEPYAVEITPDYVKLQWRCADLPSNIGDYSPVTYRVEAQEQPGSDWVTVARGVPHTDFKVTGLNSGKDYTFRVRAENDYGVSDPTRSVLIRKRSVAPILPHDEPVLFDFGPGSVHLTWRPATLPSHLKTLSPIAYTIFVQEHPFKTWRPLVRGIPQTSYYVSGLNPDHEYSFRIQADNEYGSSRPTEPVYMPIFKDIQRPISIPEVSDFDEDLTSVKLHWKPRAGSPFDSSYKYQIETWEPVRRVWHPVARGVPDTSYQLRDLPSVPAHLFRVRLDSEQAGLSEPSLPVSLSRYSRIPRVPVFRPQLYELDNDTVRLSWQPVILPEGVTRRQVRYTIEQREIPESRWTTVVPDVPDNNYRIKGLRGKSDYEFRVRAIIDGSASEPSLPVALYRRPVIPRVRFDAPEVYDVDDSSLSLRWKKVDVPAFSSYDEPLHFMIERQTLPGYEWSPVATGLTDTSYRVRDLQPYQDYNFRVRGVYPSGYTDPSPYVPVYRRPIRLSVPIARPQVWEEEPYSARLRWHRAYIPHYYSSVPHKYRIEMQEADSTASEWQPVAADVTEPDFTVNKISPRKDYNFRIRAELENGDVSEPTPPIHYHRSKLPMTREPFALAEYKPVEYDVSFANRTYVEHLTKFVPPRLPIDKPDMVVINPETVELSWKPARIPESIKYTSNLTYAIEVRNPPSFEWHELVSGLKVLNHTVKNLHIRIDYMFRVRAWNEYGSSEPSLPVSFYRPIQPEEEEDDEEFEREFDLCFGHSDEEGVPIEQVPPKLPMDTPKIITQLPDSLWFSWLPARIPAYATQTPITYVVEMKEPPSTNWRRDVTNLVDCQYIREGLNPTQDYHIRVRAESEFGTSDPTLPIIIQRSRGNRQGSGSGSRSGSRRSSMERDEVSLDTTLDSTLGSLTAGVPPRMSANRPMSTNAAPDRLTLSWSACRVPSYIKNSHVSYVIEKRELPSHIWLVVARDVSETRYDITGLNPQQDYMFRVRAKNDFGLSEPTLPMTLYRERDDYVPQKIRSRSGSRDSSIYARSSWRARRSSSFDHGSMRPEPEPELDSCMTDKIPTQPEYITTTYDTQYGVLGRKGKVSLQVRGYPIPTINWYRGEEKLAYGDRYNSSITPQGAIILEISDVGLDSVGEYKCYAENESGAAVKLVTLELADAPTVLEPMKDELILTHTTGMLTCRVDAFPSPTVKWTKDWRPVADSTRVKMVHQKPDSFSLEITNALGSDAGVYACTIENIAGKITLTSRLSVEDTTPSLQEVKLKTTPIEEQYHILEELGRGRHGIVRRVIEMSSGKSYAANFIYVHNRAQKNFFLSEFEVLRSINQMDGVLRLHDAFETDRSLILVTEILTEPELLEKMTTDGDWTEAKVAVMVKKLLTILRELDSLGIVHLDIKPSNLRVCGPEMTDIKLINFGFSRFLVPGEDVTHNYGTVGYASPEQVINDVLESRTDMWAVGVLTYVLLSGQSPFAGSTESEILTNIMDCKWDFDEKAFEKISKEAQDFICKLIVAYPSDRISVDECLNHPWLTTESDQKLDTDKIKQFYSAEKLKTATSKVYTVARLQNLTKLLQGTSALYQPAVDTDSGEIIFPDSDAYGDYLEEDAWYEWQLQYLDDPDTQYFPLHKKSFTVRESKHTSEKESSKLEEKEDKMETEDDTNVMFRNKIQTTTFSVGEDVTFSCTVVSQNEAAVVTWYRDEQLLSEAYRVEQSFDADTGRATLRITNTKDYDAAVYKCVARNKDGRVSCQARLLVGDKPGKPGRPVITQTSGTEAFMSWTQPISDGNTYMLGYRIDFKKQGDAQWTCGPYITEEYAIVSGLVPSSTYMFRVSCHNKYGTSPFSWASLPANTLETDAPSVTIAAHLEPLVQFSSFTKQQLILPAESRRPSLSVADDAKIHEADPTESYTITDTIAKGKYGEYKACTNKTSNQQCVMKVVPYNKDNHASITSEFDILCTLRQIHVVTVLDSYISGELFYMVFERMSGINVLQYLSLQKSYKEELVSQIVRQILDALQYLQRLKIMHLNLQPSSVVMATRRRPHVKLRDFTLSKRIEDDVEVKVPAAGYPDFVAPEVIKGEPVELNTDLWSVGVLTFTMLGGVSPFGGKNLRETLSRVLFGRYKASDLYDNVSKEGIQFINKLLKRLPKNRPNVTKTLNSRWLQLSDSMLKVRNSRVFAVERLRDFSKVYTERRASPEYMDLAGVSAADLPKPTPGPVTEPAPRHRARIVTERVKPRSKSPVRPIGLANEAMAEERKSKEAVNKLESEIVTKQNVEVELEKKDSNKVESSKTVAGKIEADPIKKESNKLNSSKIVSGKQSSQEEPVVSGDKSTKIDKTVKKTEEKPKTEKVKQKATKVETDKPASDNKKSPEQTQISNASPKQSATDVKGDKMSEAKPITDNGTKKPVEQKSDDALKQNVAESEAEKTASTESVPENGMKKSLEQKETSDTSSKQDAAEIKSDKTSSMKSIPENDSKSVEQKSDIAPSQKKTNEQNSQNKQKDIDSVNEKQIKLKENNQTEIETSKNETIENIPKPETPVSKEAASDEKLEKVKVSEKETVQSIEQKEIDTTESSPKSTESPEKKLEPAPDETQLDKSAPDKSISETITSNSDTSNMTPEAKEEQQESKENKANALPQTEIKQDSITAAAAEEQGMPKEEPIIDRPNQVDEMKSVKDESKPSSIDTDISKSPDEEKMNQEQKDSISLTTTPSGSKSETLTDNTENQSKDKLSEQNETQKSVDPSSDKKISEPVNEKQSVSESVDHSKIPLETEAEQKQTDIAESSETQSETVKQISPKEESESKMPEISKSAENEIPAKLSEAKSIDQSAESVTDKEVNDSKEKEANSETQETIDSSSVSKPTKVKTDGQGNSVEKLSEEKTVNEAKAGSNKDKSDSQSQEEASVDNVNNAEDKPESQTAVPESDRNGSNVEEKVAEKESPEEALEKTKCLEKQETETRGIQSSEVALEDEIKPTQKPSVECSKADDEHKQERLSEVVEKMAEDEAKEITKNALNDIANALQNIPSDVGKETEKTEKEKSPTPVKEEPVQNQDKPAVLKEVETKLEKLKEIAKEDSVIPGDKSEITESISVEKDASLASDNSNESGKEAVAKEIKVETPNSVAVEGNVENSSVTDITGISCNDVNQKEVSVTPENKSDMKEKLPVEEAVSLDPENLNESSKESVEKEAKSETSDSAKVEGNTENASVQGSSCNGVNGKEVSLIPEDQSEIASKLNVSEAASVDSGISNESEKESIEAPDSVKVEDNTENSSVNDIIVSSCNDESQKEDSVKSETKTEITEKIPVKEAVSLESENLDESVKESVEKEVKSETPDTVKVEENTEKSSVPESTGISSNGVIKKEDSEISENKNEIAEKMNVTEVASASEKVNGSEKESVGKEVNTETSDSVKVEGNTDNSSVKDTTSSTCNGEKKEVTENVTKENANGEEPCNRITSEKSETGEVVEKPKTAEVLEQSLINGTKIAAKSDESVPKPVDRTTDKLREVDIPETDKISAVDCGKYLTGDPDIGINGKNGSHETKTEKANGKPEDDGTDTHTIDDALMFC